MKKFVAILFVSILFLTGCGKSEKVVCTTSQTMYGIEMSSELNVYLKDSNFDKMDMTIDIVIPDSLMSRKADLVEALESQYADFETQYGVKPVTKETDKGAKISMNMNKDQAVKFSGSNDTKATKKQVIETFEAQGFSCK